MESILMEEGGDAGYRTPGSGAVEGEGVEDKTPETPSNEGGEVTPDSLESMDQGQLLALIKSEGLDIDPSGMSPEQLKWAVAEGLGFEVLDGEEEDGEEDEREAAKKPEYKGIEQRVRAQLEKEYGEKLRKVAILEDKVKVLDLIESDPQTYIPRIAQHFGVQL